jgi:hypothetical protein
VVLDASRQPSSLSRADRDLSRDAGGLKGVETLMAPWDEAVEIVEIYADETVVIHNKVSRGGRAIPLKNRGRVRLYSRPGNHLAQFPADHWLCIMSSRAGEYEAPFRPEV